MSRFVLFSGVSSEVFGIDVKDEKKFQGFLKEYTLYECPVRTQTIETTIEESEVEAKKNEEEEKNDKASSLTILT